MPLKKDLGQWISHFKDSNAPQFKGKSEEERKNMALAAYRAKYGSLEEKKKMKEYKQDSRAVATLAAMTGAGQASIIDFLQQHNLEDVKLALRLGSITKYELRDVINGQADPIIVKKVSRALQDVMNEKVEGEGATAAEEDKFHRDLDKLVHKTFGHSSDEKKKMKEGTNTDQMQAVACDPNKDDIPSIQITLTDTPEDPRNSPEGEFKISALYHSGANGKMAVLKDNPTLQKAVMALLQKEFQNTFRRVIHGVLGEPFGLKEQVDQKQADIYAYQFMQYFDKMRRIVAHNFGDDTRKEFEKLVQYKFSKRNINEEAKPDFLDIDKDGDKEESMKKAARDKAVAKAMKKVSEIVVTDDAEKAEDIANKTGEEVKVVKKGTLKEGRGYDYEGKMAHSQLLSIVKNARDLFNMIGEDAQLKSWVQSKLTKAEDYLDSVRTYLEGESLTSTAPAMFENQPIKDETGVALNIGDVVKGGDGRIYQVVQSYSEGKPMMVPFDLKRRKPTSLRDKIYFDADSSIPKKLNKVMDYTATKGGFMK